MILNRVHTLLKDDRKDLRIKESAKVPWQIKYKKRDGVAKLRNISISGMLVETNTSFNPKDECIFTFDSDLKSDMYIPQRGRLVWHKRKRFSPNTYLSGIKFMEADDKVLKRMRSRVQMGVDRFVKMRRMTTIAGFSLCAVIVVMMGCIAWYSNGIYRDVVTANQRMLGISGQQTALSSSYVNLYRVNEIKLSNATKKLNIANQLIEKDKAVIVLFTQELEATKALLNQTETMLIQANDRNVEITNTLQALRDQGEFFSPEQLLIAGESFMSIASARSLMSLYQGKIKSVKKEIKRLKGENRAVRAATIARIDDQKLQIGNNGYFTKDGKAIHVNEARYNDLKINSLGTWRIDQTAFIDIIFFE